MEKQHDMGVGAKLSLLRRLNISAFKISAAIFLVVLVAVTFLSLPSKEESSIPQACLKKKLSFISKVSLVSNGKYYYGNIESDLVTLIRRGNYIIKNVIVNPEGTCIATVQISGTVNGNSYNTNIDVPGYD